MNETWVLHRSALWEATPLTSAPEIGPVEFEAPVEDVAAIFANTEPWAEAEDAMSIVARMRLDMHPAGVWREEKNCYWCNVDLVPGVQSGQQHPDARTKEHLMPSSFGGQDAEHNYAAACFRCNTQRQRDLTWVPFKEHLGNAGRMSPSQRIVFKRFGKCGLK